MSVSFDRGLNPPQTLFAVKALSSGTSYYVDPYETPNYVNSVSRQLVALPDWQPVSVWGSTVTVQACTATRSTLSP